jgi:cytochrome c biogenesis protein CcmG, thiol:disulfide interchange protein DsbE
MPARGLLAVIGVVAVFGLLLYGIGARSGDGAVTTGQPAPNADLRLPKLEGSGTGAIADYRGRWTLVNFWASWCEPCRDEAPVLERFQRRHGGRDFTILGIDSEDTTGDAKAFVDANELSFPQLRDPDGTQRRVYTLGFPESFLVDPEGTLRLVRRGPVDRRYLERFVEPMIAEGAR